MSKKNNFIFLGLISAIVGGGAVLGNYLYKISSDPSHKFTGEHDANKTITDGKLWVRNNKEKQDLYIESLDKLKLHASYIKAEGDSHKYAVLVHGIHDTNEYMGIYGQHYLEQGINLLMPDLRGHGRSEGSYAGYGYDDRMDVMEWIYWIIKRDSEAKIFIHGVSMGAAAVLMTTGEHLPSNVVAAIADSSYTTALDEFTYVYKKSGKAFLPTKFMNWLLRLEIKMRSGFDIVESAPIKAVARSKTPTLFMHGDEDTFIPPVMCSRLFEAAKCQREYCITLGANHIMGVVVDPVNYWKKVDAFLAEKIK